VAVAIAAPVAIFAALYTTVFAPKAIKELLKPCIEILAGFPSVVIGFFALTVLASLVQKTFGIEYRLNAFTGGLALSFAVIPIIFTLTEDSLSALPKSMREASLALGATPWETAAFVLLPAATPGVFAAILLGVGRAFGETMIVLMATGNAALMSPSIFQSVRTMSATIGAEMAEVVFGDAHYSILFFIGICLFLFSLSLNIIAEFVVRNYLMKRFSGSTR
jgi:phosphate transport system permease protein